MNFLSYLFAIAAGSANPVQAGANAELNKGLAHPVWSTLVVYAVGLAGVLILQLIVREAIPSFTSTGLPWWAWTGGLISIASTVAGLTLAHKMGSGVFTGLSLTASLLMSIVLDQFGLVGFKAHPASALRIVGSGLMVVGIWLIAKF
jgi:transporter family-2 protein